MKRIISVLVLAGLVLCSTGAMAQKGKTDKGKKAKADPKQSEVSGTSQAEVFQGAIHYRVEPVKMVPVKTEPDKESSNQVANDKAKKQQSQLLPAQDLRSAQAVEVAKEFKVKTRSCTFYFKDDVSCVLANRMGLFSEGEKGIFYVVQPGVEPELIRASSGELNDMVQQMRDESEKYYVRRTVKRTIAGVEATLYECTHPQMKGSVWVAEGITLATDAMPYFGLRHPVLEGDYVIVAENETMTRVHLVAEEVKPKEVDDSMMEFFRAAPVEDFGVVVEMMRRFRGWKE